MNSNPRRSYAVRVSQTASLDKAQVMDIYARLSVDKRGTGENVDEQIRNAVAYIESVGGVTGEVYRDDSVSATKNRTKRKAFEALKAARRPGMPAANRPVVVRHLDRLVRSPRDLEDFLELECDVLSQNFGRFDLSTATGRANARMSTVFAALEGELKRERQEQFFDQITREGRPWWPQRPFGQERDGRLHAEESERLQRACADILRGVTLTEIAKSWNAQGFTRAGGGEWTGQALRVILMKPRIAGLRTYHGEIVGQGNWDPIVPEETWRGVVAVLRDSTRPRAPKPESPRRQGRGGREPQNLLTNIATCERCGAFLTAGPNVVIKTWSPQPVPTYFCPKGGHARVPREWLEGVVFTHLLIHVRLVDETWRGGVRTRTVAEIRQLTGGLENGRPVTHLCYRSGEGDEWSSPDPTLLAELAPFRQAWDAA